MLAARRTQPLPQDFLYALSAHQLSLGELLEHLDPPVKASQTQPRLLVDTQTTYTDTRADEAAILSLLRQQKTVPDLVPHVPRGFPALPSQHTYKAEPVFPHREFDPKKIRERATEEGRLSEEALRRLVNSQTAAVKAQSAPLSPTLSRISSRKEPTARQRTHNLWLETMEAAARAYPPRASSHGATANLGSTDIEESILAGHIPPPVNADRVNWRKPPKASSTQS